jgi:hypothetical protein
MWFWLVKRCFGVTAALVAAVAVLVALSQPPRRLTLETPLADTTVPGILHVHTNRSDGRSSPDEVAAAAARAGLKFVVFTDHGDATRVPDPPTYRSGVLCIDAVEISTTEGHYLALDMPASPYPLGGDARGVVEDVKRLGGFGVVAHPNSPKPDLSWRDWEAPFDAIEWLNPDTSWRLKVREPGWRARWHVVASLLGYPFRSPETIAHLLGETGLGADRWRLFSHTRRVVLLAGADAHAKLELTSADPGDRRFFLAVPGYETSFRALSTHVKPDRPLTGEAAHDATTIVQAIRRGHVYTAVDGVASPPSFQFTATNARGIAREGDMLDAGGPVTLRVRSNAPSSFLTILWHDDEPFATVRDEVDITRTIGGPAIYRAAIVSPPELGSIPWIISNPIYVGVTFPAPPPERSAASVSMPLFDGRTGKGWRTEADPTSLAALDVAGTIGGSELRMRYGLSSGTPSGQYASLAVELPNGAAPFDRLTFTARAEHPMRISVQCHPLGRAEGWQRSVYLDEMNREYTIRFDEAAPLGTTGALHPDPKNIHDILFVIDSTHAAPGSSGRLWVRSAALQR